MTGIFAPSSTPSDGRTAHLTDGMRQVLGRAPQGFGDVVREEAAAGTR
ncbi:hypothetical protein ACFCXS_26900 [Streptomyces sp. NPDC056373]